MPLCTVSVGLARIMVGVSRLTPTLPVLDQVTCWGIESGLRIQEPRVSCSAVLFNAEQILPQQRPFCIPEHIQVPLAHALSPQRTWTNGREDSMSKCKKLMATCLHGRNLRKSMERFMRQYTDAMTLELAELRPNVPI